MLKHNIIALTGRLTAGVTLMALGCLGIARDMGATPPAAPPRREARPQIDRWGERAQRYVEEMEAALRSDSNCPELHLRLARFLYLRASAQALYEYQVAFPDAFADGSPAETHWEAWRRGSFARDRDGQLRRALEHARRAARPGAPRAVRVTALQLVGTLHRDRGREQEALAPLEIACRIAPDDPTGRFLLRETRRRIATRRRERAAGRPPPEPRATGRRTGMDQRADLTI